VVGWLGGCPRLKECARSIEVGQQFLSCVYRKHIRRKELVHPEFKTLPIATMVDPLGLGWPFAGGGRITPGSLEGVITSLFRNAPNQSLSHLYGEFARLCCHLGSTGLYWAS